MKNDYELVRILGGVFLIGSPESEEGRWPDEGPQHEVAVPDFYIGRSPVTNEQYARFLEANPKTGEPKYWAERKFNQPKQPVVGLSWEDARKFAEWAGLRLPTEAEWEYACRAKTTTRYHSGDSEEDLARVGWYGGNSGGKLHLVGEKEPNDFGLYDMHGNVWEWCSTLYRGYPYLPGDGREDLEAEGRRVLRGGSWFDNVNPLRCAYRVSGYPACTNCGNGFRVASSCGR